MGDDILLESSSNALEECEPEVNDIAQGVSSNAVAAAAVDDKNEEKDIFTKGVSNVEAAAAVAAVEDKNEETDIFKGVSNVEAAAAAVEDKNEEKDIFKGVSNLVASSSDSNDEEKDTSAVVVAADDIHEEKAIFRGVSNLVESSSDDNDEENDIFKGTSNLVAVAENKDERRYVQCSSSFIKKSNDDCKDLAWTDINMTLNDGKGNVKKEILKDVWGTARASETTAIMGASGSGKTSLFSILTGRVRSGGRIVVDGGSDNNSSSSIRLGGNPIDPAHDPKVRSLFALVSQEDSLHAPSTPREALTFSAKLRLPRTFSDEAIADLVQMYIQELGLDSCADSSIGGGLKKGISGGEKRRTSIGVELVSNPTIIFLDEPTSGLDSFAAKQVMRLLGKVAKAGNTVLFTVHQPSSEVFASFDRLILLKEGRVMYTGLTAAIPDDFAKYNYPLPISYNPADWMLDVAEENDIATLEQAGFFKLDAPAELQKDCSLVFPKHNFYASRWVQLKMLTRRERVSLVRNPTPMIVNVSLTAVLSLISGVIFFQIGQEDRTSLLVMQAQLGAIINVLISTMMGQAQVALTIFSSERPLFLREYATKHYSVVPYFVSKLAAEAIQSSAAILVQTMIVYFMVGLQQNFGQFLAVSFSLSMTSTAVAVLLGSMVTDPKVAASFFTLVVVPQFYFSGVFISIDLIPSWIRWIQYLCSLTYASRLAMIYEFGDCTEDSQQICDQFLDQNGVDLDGSWWYWLSLVGLFIVFRVAAMVVLRKKGLNFR